MRILFLSQLVPYPIDAGPKVRSYHVLQYLVSAGHQVTLVAFRRDSDTPAALAQLAADCHAVYTVPMTRSNGRDAWSLARSLVARAPFLILRDDRPDMRRLVRELLQTQTFDAIHADQLWMAQYALDALQELPASARPNIVLDQHNAVYLVPQRLAERESNPVKRLILQREARVLQRYELATCDRFDTVVWVTDEDRLALSDAPQALIGDLTIPICVDPADKAPVRRLDAACRVTFLGGLHWPPNAEGMVWFAREVWPAVRRAVPHATLTVIGKNPPQALLDTAVDDTSLVITGYVDDPLPYLAETAVFIVPLHAGGGMRVKIIDAWSWGLPIVSTAVGAEGIQFADGVNLLLADSADAFATAVIRVLQQPQLARSLSVAGRQLVETGYDWRKTYRAWDQVYPVS